jgi:methanogenic corrinoid protein MtbC1
MNDEIQVYRPQNNVRVVTATSLFDGHDASINIFRRILQSTGVEVIHLGTTARSRKSSMPPSRKTPRVLPSPATRAVTWNSLNIWSIC